MVDDTQAASVAVLKCKLHGTTEVRRVRVLAAFEWCNVVKAFLATFGSGPAGAFATYRDDEGDWCRLLASTFDDFVALNEKALACKNPVVQIRVHKAMNEAVGQPAKQSWARVTDLSEIVDGTVLHFDDVAAFSRLRICVGGHVDVKGGWGPWTTFVVRLMDVGKNAGTGRLRVALNSQAMPARFLHQRAATGSAEERFSGDGTHVDQDGCTFDIVAKSERDNARDIVFELRQPGDDASGGGGDTCTFRLYFAAPCFWSTQPTDAALQEGDVPSNESEWIFADLPRD